VEKSLLVLKAGIAGTSVENLSQQLDEQQEILQRIVVKSRNEIRIIPVSEVYYIEAQDDYVMIYTEKERFLKQKTLTYFENHLDGGEFLRVHRSFLVRIDKIKRIEPFEKSNGLIFLIDGKKLPASRTGLSRLKGILDI
jgi:two-component system LytT family response regulator